MPGGLPGILLALLLLVSGCSGSEPERNSILQTLTIRANALNSRDVSQYLTVVSTHYSDNGKSFVQLKESLEKNFKDFEQVSYVPGTPSITIHGQSAESVGGYRMKVRIRGKELSLNGTEHLRLSKEPEGWKIIAGI